MSVRRWVNRASFVPLMALSLLLIAIAACGGSAPAEPVVVEKEVIKEVEKPVVVEKEVIKEVEKPVVVEKEVVKEVEKEVVREVLVTTFPTPTAMAKATEAPAVVAMTKAGGKINMQAYSFPPPNWHPHVTNTVNIMNSSGIYNGLIEYNPETEDAFDLRGDLATRWEVNDDGSVYTFHLDQRAMWQDGEPVTADDVVYSLDSMVDPDATPPRVVPLPALKPYYKRLTARAIDRHTVEVPIQIRFAPDFIPTLALDFNKIVAQHWAEADVDNSTQKWENQMGSGPFTPGAFKKDVSIELVKNDNYWKEGLPYIDGMTHFKMVDKGTLIAAYKTEQVLMTNWGITQLSNKEAAQLASEETGRLRVEFIQNCCFFFFFMNTSKEPFTDPRVRQAVNLALDRRALYDTFGAPGIDTLGPALGSGTWFGRTQEEIAELPGWRELNGEKHPDDIARAKELLAEAGYPDGFDVDMMVRQVVEFPDQAVMEKEDLKKIGINATIGLQDSGTGFKRYLDGDWIMATQGSAHFLPEPDAIFGRTFMPAGSWARYARYSPPQWFQDAYVEQAGEPDQEKRKAILLKMEDFLIHEDPGCCPITYWTARNWVFNTKIKGIHRSGSLWAGYKHETTYCDPKC